MELPGPGLCYPARGAAGGVAPMKLKLTYLPNEQEEATRVLTAIIQHYPGAKIRRDKSKAPKLCVYVTTSKPQTVAAVEKALDPDPK